MISFIIKQFKALKAKHDKFLFDEGFRVAAGLLLQGFSSAAVLEVCKSDNEVPDQFEKGVISACNSFHRLCPIKAGSGFHGTDYFSFDSSADEVGFLRTMGG